MSRRSRKNQARKSNRALNLVKQSQDQKPDTKKGLSEQIATRENSIDFYSTVMNNLPNPDPVLKKAGVAISVYEDISYDSRVQAVVGSRKSAVKSMEWDVVGENVPQSEIDFHKEYLDLYDMHSVFNEILDAGLFGFKPNEIMWASDGAKTIPEDLVGLPQRWFEYDNDNQLLFLSKKGYKGTPVPPNKFIVSRSQATYDNPYGLGAYSACFWPVSFRKNGLKFWTIFLEKYGMPFLLGKAEAGEKTSRMEEIADMLQNMVQDAIAVVPADYEVEIMESSKGAGKSDTMHKVYLDFMNIEIAMAIIGTNLTTEVQGGSLAASQSHMEVRQDIIESDARIVENTFSKLIELTHRLNFSSTIIPKFTIFSEEKVETVRSERDRNIQQADSRFKFKPDYYKKHYNLQDEDFELVEVEENGGDNGTDTGDGNGDT